MRLPNFIIEWIIRRAQRTPYFDLHGPDGTLYMQRWWLFGSKRTGDKLEDKSSEWPITARVHHIVRGDNDRHPHDHPYANISIVLRGGYFEWVPIDNTEPLGPMQKLWRGPGAVVFRPAKAVHYVELIPGITTWSIFICFKKTREWGFHTPRGFLHWRQYRKVYPRGRDVA